MCDLDVQVKNEGIRLLRLCKNLNEFIISGKAGKTYLSETDDFLKYIDDSLKAIENFVRETINDKIDSALVKSRLRDVGQIIKALNWLYIFVKEAVDADTLSIPYSLTVFLNDTARKLQKPDEVSLVVLGSNDLMYYKYNLGNLRKLTQNLVSIIKDYPVLPEEIGILKFPYCASQEILVNCILFHEMGHYIYENTKLNEQFLNDIRSRLAKFIIDNKIIEELKPKDTGLAWKWLLNYVTNLMLRWADEIFADIFAIRVLGTAFHLACLEMEQILPTDIKRNRNFSATHPADDFRFKMHAKWLDEEEWDEIIKKYAPLVFDRLKICEKLQFENNDFSINCEPPLDGNKALKESLHEWMLQEFEKMVTVSEERLSDILKDFEKPIDDFKENNSLVTGCLEHGIVPSTVYDNGQKRYPNPTTILNSGFFFYLGGMKKLLEKVESADSDIDKRINYEKRLNQWLAKAIEDWRVLLEEGKL